MSAGIRGCLAAMIDATDSSKYLRQGVEGFDMLHLGAGEAEGDAAGQRRSRRQQQGTGSFSGLVNVFRPSRQQTSKARA